MVWCRTGCRRGGRRSPLTARTGAAATRRRSEEKERKRKSKRGSRRGWWGVFYTSFDGGAAYACPSTKRASSERPGAKQRVKRLEAPTKAERGEEKQLSEHFRRGKGPTHHGTAATDGGARISSSGSTVEVEEKADERGRRNEDDAEKRLSSDDGVRQRQRRILLQETFSRRCTKSPRQTEY